jgi:hypothetical protein
MINCCQRLLSNSTCAATAWDARTCSHSAAHGEFETLQWAREHGCPWDAGTCASAAAGGYLEILKWARERDCPWNER